MHTSTEIDLDEEEGIGRIQNVICHDGFFYVLSNKKQGKLGLFLMKICETDPYSCKNPAD